MQLIICLSLLLVSSSQRILASSFARQNVHWVRPVSYRQQPRPWRTHSPSHGYQRRRHDYSAHFLDLEEAKRDPRTRSWKVNLDERRLGQVSWTSQIIFLNILTYAIQAWKPSFTAWGVKRSDLILQGRELYRLATPVFLHGGIGHLLTNMFSLSNIGRDVERIFGPGRFLCSYMLSGVAGNVLSAVQSPNPALGASGAVFGILGAYTVFLSRHEWLLGSMGESMSSRLVQTALLNIGMGFINPSIDNWGHIGGFVGGCAMAYLVGPRLYMTDLPDGGRMIVDRPVLRLPRRIESIPERMGNLAGRISTRVRVDRYLSQRPTRPWQQRRRPPKDTPTRSVKPDSG